MKKRGFTMERREFLGTATLATVGGATAGFSGAQTGERQFLEMREYSTISRSAARSLNDYLEGALVPGLNRLGLEPIGVFSPMYGSNSATVYVLIPHSSIESVLTLHARLLDDSRFTQAAGSLLQASPEQASYVRIKSSLMQAFEDMPKVVVPPKEARIFEMRRYESHNMKAGKLKVEMFNVGEIDIFRKTGVTPVFFGETVIGDHMPNLTYMVTFKDMTERDAAWAKFRVHPDWKKMSAMEKYKDTVSNVSDTIMRPAEFSQV
jgi:hypothetical protein